MISTFYWRIEREGERMLEVERKSIKSSWSCIFEIFLIPFLAVLGFAGLFSIQKNVNT